MSAWFASMQRTPSSAWSFCLHEGESLSPSTMRRAASGRPSVFHWFLRSWLEPLCCCRLTSCPAQLLSNAMWSPDCSAGMGAGLGVGGGDGSWWW